MRLKTTSGKFKYKNYSKYRIKWGIEERSKFQTEVKKFLEPFLKNHIVYSEFPCVGTLLKIDIMDATTKIAYEINGYQHNSYSKFFQKSRAGYLNQIKRDITKAKFCEINGIKLVEIYPKDLPLTKEWFKEKYNIDL